MPVIPLTDRVHLITGPEGSRFPYANSIWIEDRISTLIDTGCDETVLKSLVGRVDRIINTHYHLDHTRKNWLFPDAEVWVPEVEAEIFRDGLPAIARRVGLTGEAATRWVEELPREPRPIRYSMKDQHEWRLSLKPPAQTYTDGQVIVLGDTKVEMILAPGHCRGHSCPYLQKENILHLVDVDLGRLGPWYGGLDGSLDDFERTIQRLGKFPAQRFVTAHLDEVIPAGAIRDRLEAYRAIIDRRDERILALLGEHPCTLEEITGAGVIFRPNQQSADAWLALWERNMVRQHLDRLVERAQIERREDGVYRAAF